MKHVLKCPPQTICSPLCFLPFKKKNQLILNQLIKQVTTTNDVKEGKDSNLCICNW